MEDITKLEYHIISLCVIPVTLKVYGVTPIEGDPPVIDRQVQWYLDKIDRLEERIPIPENFHLVTRDVSKGIYRYVVKVTYEKPLFGYIPSPTQREALVRVWGRYLKPEQIGVFWYLYSPERLSKYQIGHLLREYGDSFPPPCHPVFLSYDLVGAYRSQY